MGAQRAARNSAEAPEAQGQTRRQEEAEGEMSSNRDYMGLGVQLGMSTLLVLAGRNIDDHPVIVGACLVWWALSCIAASRLN
jgi:hypothetical protein